jgi:glycosyltransferase involved in cell wall biosynthesis
MRILGVERDQSACNMYRVLQPLYKLLENGMANILTINEGAELATDFALQKVMESDIIVVHRPASEEWFKFIKTCRKYGKTIVVDYDDDPFNTSPLNPYYQFIGTEEVEYVWPDGKREMLWSKNPMEHGGRYLDIETNIRRRDLFRASFRNADMVSTTTDILREKLSAINPNTVVLPNLVDFEQYPIVEHVKKRIRIGWQGGASHYEDLHMVAGAVKKILKKHDNVDFVFWGDLRMYGLFREIPIERIECHQWVKQIVYPYKLACMNIDIGLCPIINNEFNRNKSAIKWMEYSVVKAATIASDMPPYSPVISNGNTGLLVKEDGWFDAMDMLVQDKNKREQMALNAFNEVHENHNANSKAYLWLNAYEKLLKREVSKELIGA